MTHFEKTNALASVKVAATADEIPTLRIRGDGWTLQSLDTQRDAWHNATIRLVKDGLTYMVEQGAVRVRGSSSAVHHAYVKKNYSLEFRDLNGNDKAVSIPLLSLDPESDFVLHSSFWDPSYLRNVISYKLYRQMGRWAPRTRYLNLVINGEYRGLYILVEKIKRGQYRVNLPKLVDRTDGACSVYGGYIFKREGDGAGWNWESSNFPGIRWWLHYPEPDKATDTQKRTIRDQMNWVIDGFFAGEGWRWAYPNLIDVGSWVDYTLLTELSMNGDGYYKSVYFNMMVTDQCTFTPLVMGPPWDFDLAYGNAGGENWIDPAVGCKIDGTLVHSWVDPQRPVQDLRIPQVAKLWGEANFKRELKVRWFTLRQNALSEPSIMSLIDDYSRSTAAARLADRNQWASQLPRRDGTDWPAPCDKRDLSLDGEVLALKGFIRQRLEFLDRHLSSF